MPQDSGRSQPDIRRTVSLRAAGAAGVGAPSAEALRQRLQGPPRARVRRAFAASRQGRHGTPVAGHPPDRVSPGGRRRWRRRAQRRRLTAAPSRAAPSARAARVRSRQTRTPRHAGRRTSAGPCLSVEPR